MSARVTTALWLAQRASAAVLALAVAVHLVTMVGAVRGGLDAREILSGLAGHGGWLAFYATFVLAAAVHGAIGIRGIVRESTPLPPRLVDAGALALALALAALGLRAVLGLYGASLT